MEKAAYVFTYVSTANAEANKRSTEPSSDNTAAIEAKWRVIDYILKQIIVQTG
ncbi:hypothetical protein [Paenibacillus sp. CF384]|uniref:hypothetical protein n=1 Tax=Paenibacillus sp. CF384 TaxID=1884382 RepID=UPI0008994DF9|nr:hypothetical protein [Paenibacillus sp. CF384]SDW91108.1 hypothetical protein SAMN05518855_1006258 [Paenibacillus sp. CF384]